RRWQSPCSHVAVRARHLPIDHQPRTAAERNAMHHVVHRVIASRSVLRTSMLVILVGAFWPHSALAQQTPANQSAPQVVSCVSTKGQRQVCTAVTAAGVALLRSTGESSCLLGKTWGYDDAGVWVFD